MVLAVNGAPSNMTLFRSTAQARSGEMMGDLNPLPHAEDKKQ